MILLFLAAAPLLAGEYPLHVQSVAEGIWALVGEKAQRSPDNLANNATFGVIDTAEGLVLVDPGGTWKGAAQIERAIRSISDKPVILVVNTGGQDHRWLGNGYWQAMGARVIAAAPAVDDQKRRGREFPYEARAMNVITNHLPTAELQALDAAHHLHPFTDGDELAAMGARVIAAATAVDDQKRRGRDQIDALNNLVGETGTVGTEPAYADETFDQSAELQIGGVSLQLRHFGAAHTPGDSIVWLPRQEVLFSGDIVYLERMLGVGPQSNLIGWLDAYAKLRALPAQTIVPGHGGPAAPDQADAQTGAYLKALHQRVAAFIDDGGSLEDISQVDQSEFMHLETADQLAGRNAHQAFQQLEFAQ